MQVGSLGLLMSCVDGPNLAPGSLPTRRHVGRSDSGPPAKVIHAARASARSRPVERQLLIATDAKRLGFSTRDRRGLSYRSFHSVFWFWAMTPSLGRACFFFCT